MSLTPRQLSQYAKVCQKYGITELKIEGVEFTIMPHTPASSATAPAVGDSIPSPDAPSEEQLLYWSSGQAS